MIEWQLFMPLRMYFLLLNKLVKLGIDDNKLRNVVHSRVSSIICGEAKAVF